MFDVSIYLARSCIRANHVDIPRRSESVQVSKQEVGVVASTSSRYAVFAAWVAKPSGHSVVSTIVESRLASYMNSFTVLMETL